MTKDQPSQQRSFKKPSTNGFEQELDSGRQRPQGGSSVEKPRLKG